MAERIRDEIQAFKKIEELEGRIEELESASSSQESEDGGDDDG